MSRRKRCRNFLWRDDDSAWQAERENDHIVFRKIRREQLKNRNYLVPTLLLIVENLDNREKSFQHMPRRSYFRHRDELLDFFVALQCTYDLRGRDVGEVPTR